MRPFRSSQAKGNSLADISLNSLLSYLFVRDSYGWHSTGGHDKHAGTVVMRPARYGPEPVMFGQNK